ncbi:hypothetical protein CXB51_028855 [Gossypium anomalum]|uniref:Uncharacterized protein n=1 Tax=Gossypium anomalum TaxID=47600 RepID=A0A8J6CL39_9ROSI|nr:hypothetical protein CXB51_028855 [Gossypium anomalum]
MQLGLPVDGSVLTGSAQSDDWGAIYYDFFGAILNIIYGGQIDMGWLQEIFPVLGDDLTKAQFRFLFLRPRVDHPYTFSLVIRWNHSSSYEGIPTVLKDIQFLLDQRSEAHFQWTPYKDPTIRAVIPDEFLHNPNIWHVKVLLVSYATIEMHQTDRVFSNSDFDNRFSWHLRRSMMNTKLTYGDRIRIGCASNRNDPWQAIFTLEREEASTNPCQKGTTGPIKSKDKGWRSEPIKSAHTITDPNGASDNAHTTTPSNYTRCVS